MTTMDRRGFLRLVGAAGAATGAGALLAACNANPSQGPAASGSTTRAGGTLYILSDSSSTHFDPAKSQSLAITSAGLVHRRLTAWDVDPGQIAKVVPDMATDTGRSSDNGATWTYTLKDGLSFSDGSPITSADLKWGIERTFDPAFSEGLSYHKTLLAGASSYQGPFAGKTLDSIETPDAKTIVFHLARPYGDWPWIVSLITLAPVPHGKGANAAYDTAPITSGPYQVASYQNGTQATLTRNTHWTKASDPVRPALPDKIIIQMSQDDSVISQRLVADNGADQNAFGASFVDPAQLAQLQSNPSARSRLVTSQAGAIAYLAMNTQRGALTDVNVRKAFIHAVNRTSYQVATAGTPGLAGPLATTLITPGIAGRQVYDLYQVPAGGDPNKAKQLLAAAGHPNGLSGLSLLTSTSDNGSSLAQSIAASLALAGIKVTIQTLDDDTFYSEVTGNSGNYDLALASWQPDFPSANANIQPLYESSQIGNGGFNLSRYSSAEVDGMIAAAQATIDPTQAGQKWAAVDKRIMQDAPIVPLIYTRNSFLHGSKVDNFQIPDFPAYPNYLKIGISQ
jgi:peptide/nickel transport system substrate-binding protein